MQTDSAAPASFPPDAITLAASTWLASGIVFFGFTPLPLRDAALGWSPAFWLLAAPALVLAVRWTMSRFDPRAAGLRPTPARRRHRASAHSRRAAIRRGAVSPLQRILTPASPGERQRAPVRPAGVRLQGTRGLTTGSDIAMNAGIH